MRGGLQKALKRLVQSESELIALSERLVSSALASTSAPSVGAITAQLRNEPALQRLAPRLLSTLAASSRSGSVRYGGTAGSRLLQQLEGTQQVRLQQGSGSSAFQAFACACRSVLSQQEWRVPGPSIDITSPCVDQPALAFAPPIPFS